MWSHVPIPGSRSFACFPLRKDRRHISGISPDAVHKVHSEEMEFSIARRVHVRIVPDRTDTLHRFQSIPGGGTGEWYIPYISVSACHRMARRMISSCVSRFKCTKAALYPHTRTRRFLCCSGERCASRR